MDKFIIEGGRPLRGTIGVAGSKNAVLALMPATLLAPGIYRIRRTPNLRDVWTMSRLLAQLGAHVERSTDGELFLDTRSITSYEAPYEHVKKMRASIYVLGPLLARYGRARVSLPGGCAFGPRPVDLHIKAMEKLGADISIEHGYINARADRLRGNTIHLDVPSVGATVNVLYAATLAEGETLVKNAAIEPEVTALAQMLVAMGANIEGIGTSTLRIIGVSALNPVTTIENIPDRIEAATYLIAAAMTRALFDWSTLILITLEQSSTNLRKLVVCWMLMALRFTSVPMAYCMRLMSQPHLILASRQTSKRNGLP